MFLFALQQPEKRYHEVMKKLEGKELYRRLQESRNSKKLLMRMSQKMDAMEKKINVLEESVRRKDEMLFLQKNIIEKQSLRIEYLEKIVFGKSKKRKDKKDDNDTPKPGTSGGIRTPRDSSSYQREIPEEITDTKEYSIARCPDCHGSLAEKKIFLRYLEDIISGGRRVEKQLIESGLCENCGVRKSARPVNGSRVILGENVKIMVVYFSVVMRLSYEQVKNMFRDIYHLKLSDGEIERIFAEHGSRLTAEHERIAKELLGEASHYDETTWRTVRGIYGNHAWIKTGIATTNTLFLFGKSRGKGNAQRLCGTSTQVGITDDYAGYDGVFAAQALCWSHPHRKLRDLAESSTLTGKAHATCAHTFRRFGKLYSTLEKLRASPWPFDEKKKLKGKYMKKLMQIAKIRKGDPEKLGTYKRTLTKECEKYFTFLEYEGIPMDNNRAERRLRHIVLKRKISLGSKTDKGATMLEKLYSVVLTWWWRDPIRFISNYRHLLA